MQVKRLLEFLNYNAATGDLVYKHSGRIVQVQEDGFVLIIDPESKKRKKFKLSKLCYSLFHNVDLQKEDKVVHKDLNPNNFKITNLLLLSSSQYKELKEAKKNIQGGIRLVIHPTDVYSYRLFWFQDGVEKSKVIQDVVVAKKLEKRLLLKSSKILTKYCPTD